MIFLWSPRNTEHIAKHAVTTGEAQYVVDGVRAAYLWAVGDEKRAVWGQTEYGRFLQVIFVPVLLDDVEADEFQRLDLHERIALEEGEPAVRVIHARDLTDDEKRRFSRRMRGRT